MSESRDRARQELAFCESVLAKGGLTILTETLRDASDLSVWTHYPKDDVFDPQTGAQWFYHSHPADDPEGATEHGHFHCFVRPNGTSGPIHHLIAVGVDPYGKPLRLFTVNRWVVGDDWLAAEPTIALLERFDLHMPRPSYLVNRWLTAMIAAYEDEISALIHRRDTVLATHASGEIDAALDDRALEVISELRLE
ncbi:MAG TPA: hypothetical protein VNS12_01190 [Pelagibacterium sp.]|uniref:DUF6969 family protein n=1 Tax=Pelagibacterium sp. TaxID=1967288 RepID=UPI002BE034AD|nr:hypothetical protein [Pelagibacterium sp.]HWJ86669.1 hypothetical protein [Pelagibacterium sp.]